MAIAGEVVYRIRAEGAEQAEQQINRLGQSLGQLGQTSQALGALAVATFAFQRTLSSILQLNFASEVESIRNQFVALTGSIEQADAITDRMVEFGIATRFSTSEVARFGAVLMAMGGSADQTLQEMRPLLDLMAGLGIRRSDFERVGLNLIQLRSGAGTQMDIRQMVMAMPGIGAALARALGREQPLRLDEMTALMSQMGGEEFFQLLIRAGERFAGAAERLTITDTIQNFAETIALIMQPSAELFASLLRGLLGILSPVARVLRDINERLWGLPGLIFALSVATAAATASLRLLAGSGIGASLAQLAAGLRGLTVIGTIGAILRFFPRLLSWMNALVGVVFRFARVLNIGGLLSGLVALTGRLTGNRELGDLGIFAGIGSILGGIVGSIIPGLGTMIGSVIGAALGSIVYLIKSVLFGRSESQRQAQDAAQQTARNTARMASNLEEIRVQLVGGGPRARMAATRYEVEAYLRRVAVAGI